ncbi:hypothetical protein EVAR_54029_1 [Eumeta japonica]|uniref:Uncharacterized protein n=1 Tax=Eumeta variegata TaxID=151549 RepID=A0A4C1YNN7_EUMVA|nr:hypothetical protein EVAR_54029_1 [Eumeta japonica]
MEEGVEGTKRNRGRTERRGGAGPTRKEHSAATSPLGPRCNLYISNAHKSERDEELATTASFDSINSLAAPPALEQLTFIGSRGKRDDILLQLHFICFAKYKDIQIIISLTFYILEMLKSLS